MRFYAPRMRGGRARCANQLLLAASRIAERFAINEASRTIRTQDSRSPVIHASESGESESLALANDPSRQATPLCQSAASCRVMHRRVPWRGVPLPRLEAFAAWPDERVLPSSVARRRSWGSCSARLKCHWSAAVSKASFASPCADVRGANVRGADTPASGSSLANWL
jgi:hypothetical protein